MTGLEILILKGLSLLATGAAAMTVITFVVITLSKIASLFDDYKKKHSINKHDVGFYINEGLESGQYHGISGVFNKKSGEVKEAWKIKGEQDIDPELTKSKMTIFN